MNNLKRTGLALLVAVIAFGSSAFTAYKTKTVYRYYKTSVLFGNANDRRGYQYYSGDMCAAGGDLCSAEWNIGNNLPPGEGEPLPLTGIIFIPSSERNGHFDL